MILFKIFQQFLLPSIFIWLLLFVGAIFIFRSRKRKIGKVLLLLGIILYYLFSITPIIDLTLYPLENQYKPVDIEQLGPENKIVLLTGEKVARGSEALRLYFAVKAKGGRAEIIISGVSALNPSEDEENKETREFLLARGVDKEDIIQEDKSRNTFESAQNIKALVGETSFYLVTSAYHMPRSMEAFQRQGTKPIAAPIDISKKGNYNLFSFFPSPGNLVKANLAFHEYFGILYYKIKL